MVYIYIYIYIYILLLLETKLVDSFPRSIFSLSGSSKSYILERDSNGGCILLCIRHEIPLRLQRDYKIKDNPKFFFR